MNRNALVGAGLAALVLAALAVGIATFVSGQGIDQSAEALRTEVATAQQSVDDLKSEAVMADRGLATDLTAASSLRTEGQLTVWADESAEEALFLVGKNGDVYNATLTVPLTVEGPTTLADLTADEIIATVVTARGFQTQSGGFAAADNGNVKAGGDLTVSGNAAIAKNLTVAGTKFTAGAVSGGATPLIFDASAKTLGLAEDDGLEARTVEQLKGLNNKAVLVVTGGIITRSLVINDTAKDGTGLTVNGDIEAGGEGRFGGGLKVGYIGEPDVFGFVVDAQGALVESKSLATDGAISAGGSITAAGDVNAANATIDGDLVAGTIRSLGVLRAMSLEINTDMFTVDELGNVYAMGDLDVDGDLTAASASFTNGITSSSASVSGLVTAGTLESGPATITGDLTVTGDVNFNSSKTRDKDFVARDLIATRSIKIEGGSFTVDASGNVSGGDITGGALAVSSATISGASTFTGDVTAGNDVDVTNDLRVGNDVLVTRNLEVTGNIVYSGTLGTSTKNLTVKTVSGETAAFDTVNAGALNAATSLAVATNKFTVDASGNGAFAGNLSVAGNLTVAGNAGVTGDLDVTGAVNAGSVSATTISAGNLKSGTTGPVASSDTVSVSGMPSSASVTITPLEAVGGDFWVQISSGAFTIHHTGGATPAFSWIATW